MIKFKKVLLSVLVVLYLGLCATVIVFSYVSEDVNLGVRVVKWMYEFSTPAELASNQVYVRNALTEEEWERLQLDDTLRTVNAYYKFGYSRSKVHILSYGDGYVIYSIVNDNIDSSDWWVFQYDLTEEGLMDNIKEYHVCYVQNGGYKIE